MKLKEKILTLTVATLIAGVALTFVWAMAWIVWTAVH
ncbi:hypothetical protein UFOVP449_27 [uncultured Caudovirales phage]|uniref:Uncharacterized protein n=1 Tax=uncultured Caudovirales phage TaxID=2100421 RepID=A0A6J5M7X5_9CAUD|nr:hypothetical protein UFOVP449_27 [uncultured Caudovirales phage]